MSRSEHQTKVTCSIAEMTKLLCCGICSIDKHPTPRIPRHERTCKVCTSQEVEDEYHFLLLCNAYLDIRQKFIPAKFYTAPNKHKFYVLMATRSDKYILALANYVYYAFEKRKRMLN